MAIPLEAVDVWARGLGIGGLILASASIWLTVHQIRLNQEIAAEPDPPS